MLVRVNSYRWHYSVSNKAVGIWGNEELRREGQYRGIPRGKKAVSRGRDYSPMREYQPKWIIQRYILSNDYHDMIYTLLLTPGGGYFWEFLVGVCRLVLQILTLSQTKKCHFPHWFSDQISKIHTHFQTWSNLACSGLSDSGGDSQFPPFLFSCSCFSIQRTQLSRSLEQARPD